MADKEAQEIEWLVEKEKTRKKRFSDAAIGAGLAPGPKASPEKKKEPEHKGWRQYLGIKNLRE